MIYVKTKKKKIFVSSCYQHLICVCSSFHQKQLSEFDELTIRMVEKAQKDVLPELEISETNSRLQLKEKQLQVIHTRDYKLEEEEGENTRMKDDMDKKAHRNQNQS